MKFILLASNASIMALTACRSASCATTRHRPWFTTAYEEVTAVGRAAGVTLPPDAVDKTLNFNRNAPPNSWPQWPSPPARQSNRVAVAFRPRCSSSQEARRRHTHSPFMYAALKPYIMGAPA